jgi:hypothetical protein
VCSGMDKHFSPHIVQTGAGIILPLQ